LIYIFKIYKYIYICR